METSQFRSISPFAIGNAMEKIGKDWMLIVAKDEQQKRVNAMTASWGCMGVLWNKNICVCFIRPQRHTYGLVEDTERISIAFLDESRRDALRLCGSRSGSACDKLTEAGLTSIEIDGVPIIAEAQTVLICRKLYVDDIKKACFLDESLLSHYPECDFHRVYVCEIEQVLQKN